MEPLEVGKNIKFFGRIHCCDFANSDLHAVRIHSAFGVDLLEHALTLAFKLTVDLQWFASPHLISQNQESGVSVLQLLADPSQTQQTTRPKQKFGLSLKTSNVAEITTCRAGFLKRIQHRKIVTS
jgi:hypothetical protein